MDDDVKRIFHPDDTSELLSGWLIHAHKERDRHDDTARCYEIRRVRLGVFAVILSAIVGTSVFASLAVNENKWVTFGAGILSVAASVFTALSTFLDYATRAQRHRRNATAYKSIVQEIEEALTGLPSFDEARIEAIRKRFDEIESDSPVVPRPFFGEIQREYEAVHFVHTAEELYPGREAVKP